VAHYWALLLLERLGISDLYAAGAGRSFVFLLNMNRIFERFVTRLLSDVLQSRVSGSWLSSAPLDHRR
jgi:5-methylcytosine-specific restriction enzyme subunit McrC